VNTPPTTIDIHTHLAGPGAEPSPVEMANMIRLAKLQGIGRAVALGNIVSMGGPNPTQADITTINTNTLGAMKYDPSFFIGFCYLNPEHPPEFSLGEIERCVVRGGMLGIKFWIAVKATDKRHDPLMQRIQELDIPVLYHAWYKATEQGKNESTAAEVADLARRFPKVTIVMAHLTGVGERGVLDILDCPNMLVDTSGGQSEAGLVEYAVARLGAERVIYGSDWPIRDFGVQTGRVHAAQLSPAQRELILRRNAERVLHLKRGAR
jgi:uncharacterized protein